MYIDKSVDMVNKCNNAYHRTIKMKLIDGSLRKYINFNIKNNSKDSNFEIGDHLGISKYKNIFARELHSKSIWKSSCYFNAKDIVLGTCVI